MQVSAIKSPAIQRVPTWGGDWSTTRYDKKQDIDSQGNVYPAAMGVRGVDIELKFTPNNNANAELIGLTQSVQSVVNNALNLTPAAATRNIKSSDAININTGPGETDEGTAIDRATGYNNPIYPVSSQPSSTLDDTNTVGTWGQHGWNSSSKTPPKQDAILIDWPVRSGASTNSRQIFETTALATKGVQSGTYYGSVRWGWRTDNNGNFDTIPLQSVSQGVPSSTFMKSAEIWNAAKDSTGADTVNLPIVDVKITTARISEVIPPATSSPFSPQPPLMTPLVRERSIPAGTRIQILTYGASLITGGERLPQIKIIDGPFTGETMSILGADLINP